MIGNSYKVFEMAICGRYAWNLKGKEKRVEV